MKIDFTGASKLVDSFSKLKWWTLIAIFLASMAWIFKSPIEDLIDRFTPAPDIEMSLKEDETINNFLDELMYLTASDRVYVMSFHNGVVYYTGTHKNRMSMDYERTAKGIASIALQSQNIPVSLYTETLQETINGEYRYYDTRNIEHARTRLNALSSGVMSTACAPYFNEEGKLVAIIGIEYVGQPANDSLIMERLGMKEWDSEVLWDVFNSRVYQIGDLL